MPIKLTKETLTGCTQTTIRSICLCCLPETIHDCLAVGVPKDYQSIDEVPFEIDVLDFCINPKFGLELLKNSTKNIKAAVFQPGAENQDIENILKEKNIPFIKGCLLVGCSLYGKK